MKVKNLNNSSIKTKKLIKNTFAELIKENKELNKITVSELVKRADINRSTFYNHYDNIYSVAEELEDEIIQVLLENSQTLTSINDIFDYFDTIINYLEENENIYRLLLSSKDPLIFLSELSTDISNKLYIVLSNNLKLSDKKSLLFDISFFTGGIIYQILKYFNNDSNYSLQEINAYAKKLVTILFNKSL